MALYSGTIGKVYVLAFAACGVMFNVLAARLRERRREKYRAGRHASGEAVKDSAAERERKRRRAWRIRRAVMALLLAVFVFSAGSVAVVLRQYQVSDRLYSEAAEQFMEDLSANDSPTATSSVARRRQRGDIAPIEVDFEALLAVNGDVEGWIYCEGTEINYPVVRGADNNAYLHHSYDGSYNVAGSIFVEADNRPAFADANTIIYGHHMKNGSMFAGLQNWLDQAYYDEHPVMWLLTPEQDYRIVLVAGYTTNAYAETYTIFDEPGEDFSAYLQSAVGKSAFTADAELDPEGRYVVLSTCAYIFDNARYVLHGLLVPVSSAGGVPFGR